MYSTVEHSDNLLANMFGYKSNYVYSGKRAKPTNLCFEGGGVKGIAYCGSVKALEDYDLISDVKNYIGTSAGSGMAAVLALGYTTEEIYKILSSTDFTKFNDDSYGVMRDSYRLKSEYGWYKGDSLTTFYQDSIKQKFENEDLTFKELYEKTGNKLVVTGTSLTHMKTVYFSKDHPRFGDMPIAKAIRISMSIPLYFTAVHYEEEIFIDGGMMDNFPLRHFDKDGEETLLTLGFCLDEPDELERNHHYKIDNVSNYIFYIVGALMKPQTTLSLGKDSERRVIHINTGNVSTTDMNLSEEMKSFLVCSGYVSTVDFLLREGFINEINQDQYKQYKQRIDDYLISNTIKVEKSNLTCDDEALNKDK